MKRTQRGSVGSHKRLLLDQIAEELAACDERQRIFALTLGESHDPVALAIDDVDRRALLVNTFGVPRPAGNDRGRVRHLAGPVELLRGVAPGVVAAREKLPEAVLYRWREEALAAASRALDEVCLE